jgi:hypothetical protein
MRGNIHTSTIENFWSLFKRGVIRSFHKVSAKHLSRCLAEFTYRFNNRELADVYLMTMPRLLAGGLLLTSRLGFYHSCQFLLGSIASLQEEREDCRSIFPITASKSCLVTVTLLVMEVLCRFCDKSTISCGLLKKSYQTT